MELGRGGGEVFRECGRARSSFLPLPREILDKSHKSQILGVLGFPGNFLPLSPKFFLNLVFPPPLPAENFIPNPVFPIFQDILAFLGLQHPKNAKIWANLGLMGFEQLEDPKIQTLSARSIKSRQFPIKFPFFISLIKS